VPELVLDVGARQRLVRAAAQMGLPFFQHGTVFHLDADMPGVFVGVRVVRVDLIAHLAGERDQARVAHALLGKRIQPGWAVGDDKPKMREIVGVVGNVKHLSLQKDFTPEMYVPATQIPVNLVFIVARTSLSNAATVTAAVRDQLASVDRDVPLTHVRVFDEYISRTLAKPRFNALLLSIFAGTALLLTAIGIYGVLAYSVSQRTNEIGIRIALGAAQSNIFRLIVGQAMLLVAISMGIGLAGAFMATRFLSSLLYGVAAWDPITFAAIATLIAGVAFLACWLPARRAARVDPVIALRAD